MPKRITLEFIEKRILLDALPQLGQYFKAFFSKEKDKNLNLGGYDHLMDFFDNGKTEPNKYRLTKACRGTRQMGSERVDYTVVVKMDIEVLVEG